MAEIGASINLQVKGTSRLDRLINSASQLDSIVKGLNKNPIELNTKTAVSNLDKFDAELKALQISISKSEKGIDSAGNAINQYATQIASLQTKLNQLNPNTVAYNKVLDRQQKAIRGLAQAQGDLSKAQKDLESSQGRLSNAERNVSSARTAKLAAEALNGLADSYVKVKTSQKGTDAGAVKRPLLDSSIAQINSQADALKLVAANAKIASSEFNRFSIASQAASQELFAARQKQLSAVAFGLSGSAPSVNLGRGGANAALATRNQVQDLVNLYPQIVKSEAGLSAYGDELRRIQSLVPYASEEFRKLENVLAELNQEISGIGLRGQRSAIALPQPIKALGPTSPVEGTLKQRQQYAEAVNKQYQKQLDLSDKIDRSAIGVADKEALSLQLNQALDALGENRLEDAQKMTIEINRQVSAMSRMPKTGGTQIIGALGTGFSPISGRMPSGEIVPGSPADKGRQAKAKLSWQSALAQMSVVASELEDTAKARGAKIQMDWNLAFEKAKDIISDATLAGLQEGTKAAVSLGQQQIREMERSTANMWREFGGPALPPGFGAGGRTGGTYRTGEFSPIGGARRLTSTLASGAIIEQSLLNLQGKGVNVADRLVQLQNALNTAKQDTFEISIKSLDALSDEVARAGQYAQLQRQILAGQGTGGRGGASKESGFRPALTSAEVKAQINEIVTDFNAVAPKVGSAGDNIASTFAAELKQGASSAAAAAKTFAAAALEAIKDVFGIASPSRVMKEIAENLVSSFITELVSNIPSVKAALEQTFSAKGSEYEQPGRARTRGPSLRMEGDPRFFAALSGEPLSVGRPSPAGIFPAATPRVGAPGSAFPFQTYGMSRTQFPSDVPAALKAPRNQLSDTSTAVSEAIKEYRAAVNNFWEGEDSQFEAITKILTSSARLGAARLARRLQQGPDLTQAERIVEEARTIAASQKRSTFSKISDVVTGETRLGVSSAVGNTYQRISDSLLNSLEALGFTISDGFKDAIDRVRNAVPSVLGGIGGILPPGGFGGGRGGGGGGTAGAGGGAPQSVDALQRALGLGDLAPIARATGEQIDELTARLSELRKRIDPTTQDFAELTKQLGVLGREQERRGPDAGFLTRRFGPRGGRAISEGLVGGAFPLLFGQGIGAAALGGLGGAAGGFAGGNLGFGLSLVGTALGTAFDTLNQAAQDTGKALRYPTESFDKLKEAGLFASRQQEYYISKLIEAGRSAEAAAQIQSEIISKVGVQGYNDLVDLGDSANELSKKWAELNYQMQALIAGPVGDLLNLATRAVGAKIESNKVVGIGERIAGLNPEQRKAFAAEVNKLRGEQAGISGAGIKAREEILAKIAPIRARSVGDSPEEQERILQKSIETANKVRALRQQSVDLERSAQDLRQNIEESILGLRKRGADLERESVEFRRSVEDQVFSKRQDLERKLIENDRIRQQNAIDAFDLQLQKASVGLDPIAQSVVDAARQYLKIRAEGEAELQQNEKQLRLELQNIDQETSRYKLQVEDRVAQMTIQRDEFTRDVAKTKLQLERSIGDYVIKVEEYRLEMAQRRFDLAVEEGDIARATEIARQNGLAVPTTGKNYANVGGFQAGRQMLHGIPGYAGYDPSHASETNIHYHFAGKNPAETKAVADYLKGLGYQITEFGQYGQRVGRHSQGSQHYRSQGFNAFDIPGSSMGGPMSQIIEGQKRLHSIIGDFLYARDKRATAGTLPEQRNAEPSSAPVAPTAPEVPGMPSAPQLVGVNDLLEQYLSLQKQIKSAMESNNQTLARKLQIESDSAKLAFEQQALAPVLQFQEQNRQLEFEIQKRKERNRLLMEGMRPEVVEGELRVLDIQQALNSSLKAYEVVANESAKAELKRLGLNENLIDSTFNLSEATIANLIATTEDVKKQEQLREKLQEILNLRNQLTKKAEGEAGVAITGARDIAAQEAQPGRKIEDFIAEATAELKDLDAVAIRVSQGIGDAIGNSIASGISGLIEGTTTAKEIFANFLKDVGRILIQTGAKMIATYIAIGIARAFAGLAGGGESDPLKGVGGADWAKYTKPDVAGNFTPNLMGFAEGGFVTGPTNAVIGEGGEPEYVIPASKMSAAMSRYSTGARGNAVIPGNGNTSESAGGAAVATAPIDVRYTVERINSVDYVTADQFQAGMQQAAMQGAKQGEQNTLRRLQNAPSARRRIGI